MFSTGFSTLLLLLPLERPAPEVVLLLKLFFFFVIMLVCVSLAVVVSSDSNFAALFKPATGDACFWNPAAALGLLGFSGSFCSSICSLALWLSCDFAFVTGLERAFFSGVLRARFKAYSQTLGRIVWTWRSTFTIRSCSLPRIYAPRVARQIKTNKDWRFRLRRY